MVISTKMIKFTIFEVYSVRHKVGIFSGWLCDLEKSTPIGEFSFPEFLITPGNARLIQSAISLSLEALGKFVEGMYLTFGLHGSITVRNTEARPIYMLYREDAVQEISRPVWRIETSKRYAHNGAEFAANCPSMMFTKFQDAQRALGKTAFAYHMSEPATRLYRVIYYSDGKVVHREMGWRFDTEESAESFCLSQQIDKIDLFDDISRNFFLAPMVSCYEIKRVWHIPSSEFNT